MLRGTRRRAGGGCVQEQDETSRVRREDSVTVWLCCQIGLSRPVPASLSSSNTHPSTTARRRHDAHCTHHRKAQEEAVARPFSGPRPRNWRWLLLLVSRSFSLPFVVQLTHGHLRYGFHLKHGMLQCPGSPFRLLTYHKNSSSPPGSVLSQAGEAEGSGVRMSRDNSGRRKAVPFVHPTCNPRKRRCSSSTLINQQISLLSCGDTPFNSLSVHPLG